MGKGTGAAGRNTTRKSALDDLGMCCQVDALITVDERGQMVIPKEVRKKAGIGGGDKLALVSFGSRGKVLGVFLLKADGLADMVKTMIGPLMSGSAVT